MRNALNLACKLYSSPKLPVSKVEPTKLIDFESITSRFHFNIRLYKPMNQSAWRLVYGDAPVSSMAHNVDIGLYEGHYFYIKELDVLTSH